MSVLSSLLFGISASLDALLVGTALGLRKVLLPIKYNLLISTVTLIGTVISIALGSLLLPLFPSGCGTLLGSAVLILFGLYYIGKWLIPRLRYRITPDKSPCPGTQKFTDRRELTIPQALLLGCALSLNNIGIGFSASIAGLPFLPASLSTFLCSLGFLALGSRLGQSAVVQKFEDYADPVSGFLLVLLGLCQLYH